MIRPEALKTFLEFSNIGNECSNVTKEGANFERIVKCIHYCLTISIMFSEDHERNFNFFKLYCSSVKIYNKIWENAKKLYKEYSDQFLKVVKTLQQERSQAIIDNDDETLKRLNILAEMLISDKNNLNFVKKYQQ